ncbi:MAG: 4Fe-4S binding protein [Sedimentisphaerales bacterium]|nr:4Fe-4S binding protein [Sedimentisphaerales bacterium]
MKCTRGLLVFSYGLFSIAAQTLLFREFVTTFEGNDISIGIFFGSWFLWVGLGALVVYRSGSIARFLLGGIELLFLAYIPAFIIQMILIVQAREIAGIESYTLWSTSSILLSAIIINAPVSIITGLLFPTACRWFASNQARENEKSAVSGVYILEAAGSFAGGFGVTVLLGFGASVVKVFFILALILSLSVLAVQVATFRARFQLREKTSLIRGATYPLSFLLPLTLLICLLFRMDGILLDYTRTVKWTKLMPKDALAGSFQTAQAEYLYGVYQNQWIAMREGSVVETLPDESSAGQVAAITLSQKPDAKEIMVIGTGLGLCYKFLELPQIEEVAWSHCDGEYVKNVEKFIPARFKKSDPRLHIIGDDIREFLSREQQLFDIIILNLPDATNSVLNRYYTLEFYEMIKKSLRPDGILAVRITGGENIMGTELVNLGASTKLTLEKVFTRLVLTPGEDTWFIASDSEELTGDPVVLRDQFAAIEGADEIFLPQALLSVYLPDRAEIAMKNYSIADLPESLLINRDDRPLTHLYSLLLTAKQSGTPLARFVKVIAVAGPLVFFIPIIILIILRVSYFLPLSKLKSTFVGQETSFDSSFLVFSAGLVGIGITIVLMYMYQTRFGSLYLHIGIVSSLFMVGLTSGAILITFFLKRISHFVSGFRCYTGISFAVIIIHTAILAVIAFSSAERLELSLRHSSFLVEPIHLIFAAAFFISGLCSGCYFPLAAYRLTQIGFEQGMAGSKLETADHIGASAGGMVTSLALVPVLGTRVTMFVFIALLLANVPPVIVRVFRREKVYSGGNLFEFRRLGYILFGIAATIIVCSNLLVAAAARLKPALPESAARALADQLQIENASAVISESGRKISYFKVVNNDGATAGYIFSSEDLSPEITGFGGKINLAVFVNTDGRLIDFHITGSNETPSYLKMLSEWFESLKGRLLFDSEPFADIHTVTGATISSNAVLSALETSGQRFAGQILDKSIQQKESQKTERAKYLPDTNGIYLITAVVLSLIVIYRGGFKRRLAVLIFNIVIGGIWLNSQYSSEQMATVLSLHAPAIGLSGTFFLIIGIPVTALLFGNIYCGYICPFGAIQELFGYLIPRRFKKIPTVEPMRKARFIKYFVLVVFVFIFFVSRNRTTLAGDPLISFFSFRFIKSGIYPSIILIVAAALIGSIFYTRFWCRYLCPAGAFLSLFNKLIILKRLVPPKRFGKCEFGLTSADKMDCLYCDKCRYDSVRAPAKKSEPGRDSIAVKLWSWIFLAAVIMTAGFIFAVSVNRFSQVVSVRFERSVPSSASGGQPRNVDTQRVREMIEQNKLSGKEAEFYKIVE